jgi:hypothetical protein
MKMVMVPVFKADILQALAKFSKKDLASLLREIEELSRTEGKVTAKFVKAQELNRLSGLVSIGGDTLKDAERFMAKAILDSNFLVALIDEVCDL